MSVRLAIAAGGTGGHLIPALAIAATLRDRRPDAHILFIGTEKGIEGDMIPKAGYPLRMTSVRPFGGGARGMLAATSLVPATLQARRILKRESVDVVLGMGGYPSVPAMAAARLLKVPSLVHEQNAIAGLANELSARFTRNIAVSFPQTMHAFRGRLPRLVGVPVRGDIVAADREAARAEAAVAFALRPDRRTVLVFGGSLGAARINDAVVALAEAWRGRDDVQLLVATGRDHHERVAAAMPTGGLTAHVTPFIDRMDLAYALADVAVCRAGASTLYELAAVGLPSILVPYPFARRREQHANAALRVDAGAASMLEDDASLSVRLPAAIDPVLGDDAARARMSAAARGVAKPDAADVMASWVLELSKEAA